MAIETVLLIVTGLLAVVALVAAVVAVRAVRRLQRQQQPVVPEVEEPLAHEVEGPVGTDLVLHEDPQPAPPVRVVEGRVIVTPTRHQVVTTAMGRPAVRASIFLSGLQHALRPESRDRIAALMRREYRERRRVRRRAARHAARTVPSQMLRDDSWLGSTPADEAGRP